MRTVEITVPSPADPPRLDRFLAANLHGVSRKRVKGIIDAGQVRVGRRIERRAGRALRPGDTVEIDWRPSMLADIPTLRPADVVATGAGWWAITKPPGLPSHRTEEDGIAAPEQLAAVIGQASQPVHRLDRETSGVLVLAVGDAVARLSMLFADRAVSKTYRAIVYPAPDLPGELTDSDADMHASVRMLRRSKDGSRGDVEIAPREGRTHQVRRLLSNAGAPVLGDLVYGNPPPGGAPRMALHCLRLGWDETVVEAPLPPGWDDLLNPPVAPKEAPPRRAPKAPCEPRDRQTSHRPSLRVSRATARIIRGGHPWVVADRDTGRRDQLRAGDLVELEDPRGEWVATAVADPEVEVCARVVSRRPGLALDANTWAGRTTRALEKRRSLIDDPATTALRLIHAEADGLPGLTVDQWGPILVATRASRASSAFTKVVYDTIRDILPLPLYEKDHLVDLRSRDDGRSGDALRGRWVTGDHTNEVEVLEAGLRFHAAPLGGLTTGFYPDQRTNRALLMRLPDLSGAVVANLFAHTGAFSVAVAAGGASRVFTVDLSPRYLEIATANLERNGLDPEQHPVVASDAVRWLEEQENLDGVILDPPVFAQGRGRGRGFSAKGDYRKMVASAAKRLRPGGWLLCCRNLRAARAGSLRADVEGGIRDAGRVPSDVRRAGPSSDYPVLKGFGEGTSFHGVFARASDRAG